MSAATALCVCGEIGQLALALKILRKNSFSQPVFYSCYYCNKCRCCFSTPNQATAETVLEQKASNAYFSRKCVTCEGNLRKKMTEPIAAPIPSGFRITQGLYCKRCNSNYVDDGELKLIIAHTRRDAATTFNIRLQ